MSNEQISPDILSRKVNDTIGQWIAMIDAYSFETLLKKPDPQSWSLGQVAMHIVTETAFYLNEAGRCLESGENASLEMTEEGKNMFEQNSFPDIRITRDDSLSQSYPQPRSVTEIKQKMRDLKLHINELLAKSRSRAGGGKTKHPGLGYFSALEWIRFSEMHMRHHLRQKARIEAALDLSS